MRELNIDKYKEYLIETEKSKRTIKSYTNVLTQLKIFFESNNLDQLTKENLKMFKDQLEDKYDNVKTINGKIVIINIYLKWAKKEKLIKKSVDLDKLKLKHLKEQSKTHRPSVNESEYKRLLKHAVNQEIHMFIKVIANSGLRISEIVQYIKVSDLDKKNIKIKNKGKTRIVGLSIWLRDELKKYCKSKSNEDFIFEKSQQWYREKTKATAAAAKVNKIKVYPHSFRHYFAKQYLKNGGNTLTLQQMLGHESSKTTEIYVKLDEDELTDTFRQIKNR